ncbi:MAG: N-acetyl sugar amidotransferase, partial [Bacteroidetes bacterium]
ESALEALKAPTADPKLMEDDKEYVIKKLGITAQDFDNIMNAPIKSIEDYPNIHYLEKGFRKLLLRLRKMKLMPN